MLEFGAGMAGMVLVTVNPAFRANEVEYVLKQSRSAGVFVVNGFRGNPMLETVQRGRAALPRAARDHLRSTTGMPSSPPATTQSIELPAVSPDDPVMIQYTSGTTGFPKGALLHHRGLLNNGADTADRMGVDAGDVFVTTMPLFHTGGCVCCVIGAVSKAATQVLVEAFEPGLVLEMFGTYRGNAMVGVPTMLVAMLEHPTFRDHRSVVGQGDLLGRLHRAGRAGAAIRGKARRALHDRVRPDRMLAGGGADPHRPTASRTRPAPSACRCRTWKTRSSIPTPARPCRSARSASSAPAAITSCSAISKCLTRQPPRSMPTAGCTPAISARWTRAATARSRAGSRT